MKGKKWLWFWLTRMLFGHWNWKVIWLASLFACIVNWIIWSTILLRELSSTWIFISFSNRSFSLNFSTFCLSFTILSLWRDWPLVFSYFGLTWVCLDIKFLFKFNSKVSLSSSSFSLSSCFAKRPFFQKIVELFIFTVFVWTKKSTLYSSSSTQSQFQGLSFDFHWENSTKRSDEALLFVKHYWMSSLTSQPLHCKNDMVIEWPFISLGYLKITDFSSMLKSPEISLIECT